VVCITEPSGALPNDTWKAICQGRDQVQAPWINTDIPSTKNRRVSILKIHRQRSCGNETRNPHLGYKLRLRKAGPTRFRLQVCRTHSVLNVGIVWPQLQVVVATGVSSEVRYNLRAELRWTSKRRRVGAQFTVRHRFRFLYVLLLGFWRSTRDRFPVTTIARKRDRSFWI
jgi:hypothetical protein